jgi:monothiol glutaredoxin
LARAKEARLRSRAAFARAKVAADKAAGLSEPRQADEASEIRERIREVIETEPIVLFMKGAPDRVACGNSGRALEALRAVGAQVATVDVLPDPRIRRELTALSGWPTIPQVFVRGELIGGADIVEELLHSGELKEKIA